MTDDTPESATHVWDPKDGFESTWVKRLHLYKKIEGVWMVYSNYTGWRLAANNAEWFDEETRQGFFKEIR